MTSDNILQQPKISRNGSASQEVIKTVLKENPNLEASTSTKNLHKQKQIENLKNHNLNVINSRKNDEKYNKKSKSLNIYEADLFETKKDETNNCEKKFKVKPENDFTKPDKESKDKFLDHKLTSLVWSREHDVSSDENMDYANIPKNIYIGHEKFATCIKALEKFNIEVIINCTTSVENKFEKKEICYFRVPLSDDYSQSMLKLLPSAIEFINKKGNDRNVLIHCNQGVSRSVSVYISWLIQIRNINFRDSLKFVQGRRKVAQPNPGFIKQLMSFENQVTGTNSLSLDDFKPCSVCLKVDLDSSSTFGCGHKCCDTCLKKQTQTILCAHCTFNGNDNLSIPKHLRRRSESLSDIPGFATAVNLSYSVEQELVIEE